VKREEKNVIAIATLKFEKQILQVPTLVFLVGPFKNKKELTSWQSLMLRQLPDGVRLTICSNTKGMLVQVVRSQKGVLLNSAEDPELRYIWSTLNSWASGKLAEIARRLAKVPDERTTLHTAG
jgi:hypothetical protein